MQVIKVDPNSPTKSELKEIVSHLKSGNVVILPTQTVYIFAVDATNTNAIEKVYKIKGRDFKKPMHVIVESISRAEKYVKVNKFAKLLANKFLPGPLTLVLPKKKGVLPNILTSNLPTLGIFIPKLKINLEVSRLFALPYTTTSANLSGGQNPYSLNEVLKQINQEKRKLITLAIDAGKLPKVKPTTFLDLTVKPPKILREGPITQKMLEKILGGVW